MKEGTPVVGILEEQTEIPKLEPTFKGLYKYATSWDLVLIIIGLFFAIVQGAALPMFVLVAGALTNDFNASIVSGSSAEEFLRSVDHNSLYFVYIGIAIFGSAAISSTLLANRGEVLTARFRKVYLDRMLGQNIGYFDKLGSGEITTRIINSTTSIQEAISEKTGTITAALATFITALIIAFATQWKLSCILLSGVAFIVLDMIIGSNFLLKYTKLCDATYSEGSSIVEESISAIRTSVAFGIQDRLVSNFDVYLKKSSSYGIKKDYVYAVMLGTLWGAIYWIYSLSFWEGSRILVAGNTDIGGIFIVLTCMLMGAFEFGNIGPEAQYIAKGLTGLSDINETIERKPPIDSSAIGIVPDTVDGNIEFRNVHFRYPSRPDVVVLPDFSLKVTAGQTVALVGSSGSGKSTCIGILERFYEILEGDVLLDGRSISTLQVKWLRQQLGLVSQEPTLFGVSIYENIRYGLVGTKYEAASPDKQRELVIAACKTANAWEFIQTFDQGIDTNVGDRGFLMSGGQKQRIAIARAIVSDPKILLLDEATSALDTKSEGVVQEALDRAAKSRTTIVVAHRLSTIRNADKIVVMSQGNIIEQGTHKELVDNKGSYYELVTAQNLSQDLQETSDGYSNCKNEYLIDETPSERIPTEISVPTELPHRSLGQPNPSLWKVVKMLWKINADEHKLMVFGGLMGILLGYGYPAMAILVGKCVSAMMVDPSQYSDMRKKLNLYSGMLFMIGFEQLITGALMVVTLSIATWKLMCAVRKNMFKQFLRMDMSFFDNPNNTPGSLTSTIAKEGKAIEGLGGSTIGQIIQSLVIVIGGAIQGIAFNWRVGLVGFACIPIMLLSGFGRIYILNKLNERSSSVYERSGSLAASYASAVRTVQALTLENQLCEIYDQNIDTQVHDSRLPLLKSGLIFGFTQALTPWVCALIFWYGSNELVRGHIDISSFFIVFVGCIMGAQAAGEVFSFSPNIAKGVRAAFNIYKILTEAPLIDYACEDGVKLAPEEVVGNVELKDVYFNYPTRPQVSVLRGLNLSIKKGEFVALVGPSGCGKSTCIQMIERFYDPQQGSITFDGHSLPSLNVTNVRSHISLVQQEPLLYSGTVRENILYGWRSEDTSEVSEKHLINTCKKANIHDFIMGLPDGYDTDVGAHGGLLSGGQKQRVAIARALLRDPKVLLLDEATSALDSQSEKVVQAALDEAAKGRTTVAVAHRLSTIQKADRIYVFERGRVVESGTHEELLRLKGAYAELVQLQNLNY